MEGTEVESFKVAIIFRFERMADGRLRARPCRGKPIHRAFLLPLRLPTAGFPSSGRVRMFHWLRHHPECGNPCHHCETACPVGAITQSGEINMND
jgi:NosR/NirI family transcriptional regulator, nitrous oxide reductase regulator